MGARYVSSSKAATVIGWLFILFFALYLVSWSAVQRYSDVYLYTAHNHDLLKAIGASGETLSLSLSLDDSINGLWASPGLKLTLDGTGFARIIASMERSWDQSILTSNQASKGIVISAPLVIPSLPGPEVQHLQGSIAGTITYPQGVSGGFVDAQTDVLIPLQLTLLPLVNYRQWQNEGRLPAYLTVSLTMLLQLGMPSVWTVIQGRRRKVRLYKVLFVGWLAAALLLSTYLIVTSFTSAQAVDNEVNRLYGAMVAVFFGSGPLWIIAIGISLREKPY